MILRMDADGAVVREADDGTQLHLETALDQVALRRALRTTGTGQLLDGGEVELDLGVLRSRAQLAGTGPDWPQRWSAMVEHARRAGRMAPDGRSVRVPVERLATTGGAGRAARRPRRGGRSRG